MTGAVSKILRPPDGFGERISRERLGLRREAQRHAAFARTKNFASQDELRAPESGVAAAALPPQSKTSPGQAGLCRGFGADNP
jgi:hypothetical protein